MRSCNVCMSSFTSGNDAGVRVWCAGEFVAGVTALDADDGVNEQIVYSLVGANDWQLQVDGSTGVVTASGELTNSGEINFIVRASDMVRTQTVLVH